MIHTVIDGLTLRDLAPANLVSAERTPGVHVTDVIYQGIMPGVDAARYGPTAKRMAFAEADRENWQEVGFLWEEMLSAAFARRAETRPDEADVIRMRPGELSARGIIGSPDALVYGLADFPDIDPERPIVEEYKMTWKSAKGFDLYDKRYLPWLLQIKSYLVIAQAREARLYVCHINGGYDGYIPEVKVHRLQFTGQDLGDHWLMMLNACRALGWPYDPV